MKLQGVLNTFFRSWLYIHLQVLNQTYQVCPLDWAILSHLALLSTQTAKIMCPWMKSISRVVTIKMMIKNPGINSRTLKWKLSPFQIKNHKKPKKPTKIVMKDNISLKYACVTLAVTKCHLWREFWMKLKTTTRPQQIKFRTVMGLYTISSLPYWSQEAIWHISQQWEVQAI